MPWICRQFAETQGIMEIRSLKINTMRFRIISEYPNYEVYEDGAIIRREHTSFNGYHLKRTVITPYTAKNNYVMVKLHDRYGKSKTQYLHRIVWMAFNGAIPKGLEVCHEDCNRQNCNLDNLQLKSHSANCRNPESIKHYKAANALCHGKFNRELMQLAKSKENKERLKKEYMSMLTQKGPVRVFAFMKSAHCNYYTAVRIINEMSESTSKMGVS